MAETAREFITIVYAHCHNRFLSFPSVRITILPVQPNKLETLDELLTQAEHYAWFCMRNSGKMSPTLFLFGADGPLMFVQAFPLRRSSNRSTIMPLLCL
jgi:hypothetical protein